MTTNTCTGCSFTFQSTTVTSSSNFTVNHHLACMTYFLSIDLFQVSSTKLVTWHNLPYWTTLAHRGGGWSYKWRTAVLEACVCLVPNLFLAVYLSMHWNQSNILHVVSTDVLKGSWYCFLLILVTDENTMVIVL